MKRKFILILSLILLMGFSLNAYAVDLNKSMKAYLIGDFETGNIIESNNIDEVLNIASITKVMSYMLVMDSGIDMDKKILIDEDILSIGGSIMKLEKGKYYTVEELLNYGLIVSSNNAIYALARELSGSEASFVDLMNQKATEIGLETARFYNSTGLPLKNSKLQNSMTTRDVFKMARYAIENYDILDITNKREILGLNFFYEEENLKNTNPTLVLDKVDGLKTGYTGGAGYCLVSTMDMDDFRVIGVFMGARSEEAREKSALDTMTQIRQSYEKVDILRMDRPLDTIRMKNTNRREIEIFPKEDFTSLLKQGVPFEIKTSIDEDLNLPIKAGEALGKVDVIYDGEFIFSTELVARKKIKKPNFIIRFIINILNFLEDLLKS